MHKIQDRDFAERVRTSFDRQQAMRLIGVSMPVVEPGYTEIHLPHKAEITQQHGYIHGGVVGMIADSAAGYAASTLTTNETGVVTVEYKLNLLAPTVALLTYKSQRNAPSETLTLRSSVWRKVGSTWQLVFHQGTPTTVQS